MAERQDDHEFEPATPSTLLLDLAKLPESPSGNHPEKDQHRFARLSRVPFGRSRTGKRTPKESLYLSVCPSTPASWGRLAYWASTAPERYGETTPREEPAWARIRRWMREGLAFEVLWVPPSELDSEMFQRDSTGFIPDPEAPPPPDPFADELVFGANEGEDDDAYEAPNDSNTQKHSTTTSPNTTSLPVDDEFDDNFDDRLDDYNDGYSDEFDDDYLYAGWRSSKPFWFDEASRSSYWQKKSKKEIEDFASHWERLESPSGPHKPLSIAFATVHHLDELWGSGLQIAHLCVHPQWRRRGIATAFLRDLMNYAIKILEERGHVNQIVAIDLRNASDAFKGVFTRLPILLRDTNGAFNPDWSSVGWAYWARSSRPILFGSYVQKLREQYNMSRAMLAFKCGVSRATINMLERDERNPGPDLLRNLASFLAREEREHSALLYSLVGYEEEEVQRLLGGTLDPEHFAPTPQWDSPYWVLKGSKVWLTTDIVPELVNPKEAIATANQLENGQHRAYLLPDSICESATKALIAKLSSLVDSTLVYRQVRIYSVPRWTCSSRRALIRDGNGQLGANSIGNSSDSRWSIDDVQRVIEDIEDVLKQIDRYADQGTALTVDGISRFYPLTAKTQAL